MEGVRLVPTLGPYVVETRIGSGGMGVVYRARHTQSGELAALKTVPVDSTEQLAAFRREIQVLAGLHHPGIVRILDDGISGTTAWYAMELVHGRPLSSLLRGPLASETEVVSGTLARRSTAPLTEDIEPREASAPRLRVAAIKEPHDPPPLFELLRIVRKVCSALGFLHSHGLVHRDLKPENILIRPDGAPVLVDFGIVGQFGDSRGREVLRLSRSAGTLAYMAPEQASGLFTDARADLFSLGCVLYECIVGGLPFGPSGLYDLSLPPPPAPSRSAPGIPPELDDLVMGLLAKDPRERVGYAEDVAATLDRIINDDAGSPAPTAEPVYLYRPDFAGRDDALDRLTSMLRQPREQRPAITLISGESGLGKTRLVLELGARAVAAGMTVVTGECKPVGAVVVSGGARAEPLHPFQNFLLLVADACRAGGKAVTERLLGGRAAILAPFEPAFARLLADDETAVPALSPELSRARVFAALRGLLEAFTLERRLQLLLLIDDLQWADSLSLEFLATLAVDRQRLPCCIVATYRSEDVNDELAALLALPDVLNETLGRFDHSAVKHMVSGMLALPEPPADWVAFLQEESRGNPFFIAEYLRAAISERLLTRSRAGRWTLDSLGQGSSLRERLGLPATIGALVGRRLSGLDEQALLIVQAAAVLGRQFDVSLVGETAGIERTLVDAAYARLRQRQILDDESAGHCGFVHDKLREIAYGLIDPNERTRLHGRAAQALEQREKSGAGRVELGALGHHHAEAGNARRAADYFERAAARARKHHANRDAVRFYRLALAQAEQLARTEDPNETAFRCRVREALAEVLFLNNELDDARAALDAALNDTPPEQCVARARRRRLLARTWERQHQHERALALYAQAEADLGEQPQSPEEIEEFWFERVQIQIQSAMDLYFLSRVSELSLLIERVRPSIELRGTPLQRAQFFQTLVHMNVRRDRYRVTAETLDYAGASLSAAEQQADERELSIAHFTVAFPMMFAGQDADAEPHYRQAIAGAERVGDMALQARFLAYFAILQRRLGRVSETRATSERVLEIAQKQGFNDYIGVAHANLCWVAYREQGDVETPATEALSAWDRLPKGYTYPLQWLARIPLAAYFVAGGRTIEAVAQWTLLLDGAQCLLPDDLIVAIRVASGQRSADVAADGTDVARLVELAQELRLL
jgi:eukaryotic-like serine/threonine-protein kinase